MYLRDVSSDESVQANPTSDSPDTLLPPPSRLFDRQDIENGIMKFSDVSTADLSSCFFRNFLVCLVIESTDLRWPGGDFAFGSGCGGSCGSKGGSGEIKSSEIDLDDRDSGEFPVEGEGEGRDRRVTDCVGAIEGGVQGWDDGGGEEDDFGGGLSAEL